MLFGIAGVVVFMVFVAKVLGARAALRLRSSLRYRHGISMRRHSPATTPSSFLAAHGSLLAAAQGLRLAISRSDYFVGTGAALPRLLDPPQLRVSSRRCRTSDYDRFKRRTNPVALANAHGAGCGCGSHWICPALTAVAIQRSHGTANVANGGDRGLMATLRLIPAMVDWMTLPSLLLPCVDAYFLLRSAVARTAQTRCHGLVGARS